MKKYLLLFVSLIFLSCSSDDDSSSMTWDDVNYSSYNVQLKASSLSGDNIDARFLIRLNDETRATTETLVTEFEMGPMHAGDLQSRYTQNSDACKVKSNLNDQADIIQIENKGDAISVQIIYTLPTNGDPKHIISFEMSPGTTHTEDLPCRIENPETFFNE